MTDNENKQRRMDDRLPNEKLDWTEASAPQERIWQCKIGGLAGTLPPGADAPMRAAVYEAFRQLTGADAQFCFSGWAAELDEIERAVVEDRLPIAPAVQAQAPLEVQCMADCMDMVRQELIEAGVIDSTVPPMMVANAVCAKLKEVATIPAAPSQAAADVLAKLADGYESGFFASAPSDLEGRFTLHYSSPQKAEAAFMSITNLLENAVKGAQAPATAGQSNQQQIARWWSLRGSVITAAINQEEARFPVEDLSELLNVFDAAIPDDSSQQSAQGEKGGSEK